MTGVVAPLYLELSTERVGRRERGMLTPIETLEELRSSCVPSWSGRQLVVTTLKAIGWSDKHIAGALGIDPRSVRRNIDSARARISTGAGGEPGRDALIAWWWCHTPCCMAGALHALEAGKLLDSP